MPKIIKDGRVYGAAPSTLADLSDTTVSSPTNNQVLKYNASTQKWVNGVGSAVISCTQTEYNAWKTAGTLNNETMYVITDAPNLNATAQNLSYDGGVTSTYDEVESKLDEDFEVGTRNYLCICGSTQTANNKQIAINFALCKQRTITVNSITTAGDATEYKTKFTLVDNSANGYITLYSADSSIAHGRIYTVNLTIA